MKLRFIISALVLLLGTWLTSQAQTPAQILQTSEEMRRGIKSSQAEMTMTIVRPTWTRSMSMKS
ncbi:MAG: outer membrane lipoprotein-sorting protein, partial [Bacteroidota bacterium]